MWPTSKTKDQICCGAREWIRKWEMGKPGILLDTDYKSKIHVLSVKDRVN